MNTLLQKIGSAVVVGWMSVLGFFGGTPQQVVQEPVPVVQNLGAAAAPIAGCTYNLSGAGTSGSASSITLASLTICKTGQKIQDSDLQDTFYITIEPGVAARQEIVSCTTVVQNANNTATLSGCSRGLSPISPYTASSTLQSAHAGGAQVIFSDPPQQWNLYAALADSETITGTWSVPWPQASSTVASRGYVDATAFSGAGAIQASESAIGYSELATEIEQASSTQTGGAGPLVLQARYATSTYNSATAGLKVVVTQNNGKIDTNFIATSSLYATSSFSGTPLSNIGKNVFIATTTGTSTWSVPTGVTRIHVRLVGGGGGGGYASGNTSAGTGGGGASGGYAEEFIDVSGTSTIQYFIGSGGAGGTGSGQAASGTWTTFGTNGSFVFANGGSGGNSNGSAGTGGTAQGGDINIAGDDGQTGGTGLVTGGSAPTLSNPVGGKSPLSSFGNGGSGASGGSGSTSWTANGSAGKQGALIITY